MQEKILSKQKTRTSNIHSSEFCAISYDIFGSPYQKTGSFLATDSLDFGYLGKPYNADTELYDYGFRDYSPEIARFTTVDPIRDGRNWYCYVENDPVNYVDLWGLCGSDGEKKVVVFMYTYKDSQSDQKYKKFERFSINDDIELLELRGFDVKVYEYSTKEDIIDSITDNNTIAIITSGHGYTNNGGVQTSDKDAFTPNDLKNLDIGDNLELVIFENCYQGDLEKDWEEAFGNNIDVVGWENETSVFETVMFNTCGIFDDQNMNLEEYLDTLTIIDSVSSAAPNPQ